jgi:ATP-binding cassette, subfamily B, bacterial MsbA
LIWPSGKVKDGKRAVDRELLEAGQFGGRSRFDKFSREAGTFFRFLKLLAPYKTKVILIMLLILVGVPLGEIGMFLGRVMIDDVVLNFDATVDERLNLLYILLAVQIGFWLIHHAFRVVREVISYYLDLSVSIRLKKWFYDHLHRLDLSFLRSRPVGEHMFRTTADTSGQNRLGVIYMITDDIPQAFALLYRLMWAAGLMVMIDWRILLFTFLYIIPYTGLSHYLYTIRKGFMRQHKIQGQRMMAVLRDGLRGAPTVKGFGNIAIQVKKYARRVLAERRAWWKLEMLYLLTVRVILWFVEVVTVEGLWIYAMWGVMAGRLSIGEFFVVMRLASSVRVPMEQFIKLLQSIRIQLVPAERILETLDVEPAIVDGQDAYKLPALSGKVEFKDVHFSYVEGEPVLRGLNLKIDPGESVAFVGPSGAGKSTLLYLIYRLYDPQSGQVLLDGHDVRDVRVKSLCDQLGVVLQDTHLFGGSFADNIRYGKLKASDAEVIEAARAADIDGYIDSLPEGYDRDLGEGTRLSGGQRQRMGIARALIRKPKVLILDEATASLDARTENHFLDTIEKLMAGRTTLMISHRLVTVTGCDRIVVMEEGRVLDQGTHDELLERCDLYRSMWLEQTRGNVDGVDEADGSGEGRA